MGENILRDILIAAGIVLWIQFYVRVHSRIISWLENKRRKWRIRKLVETNKKYGTNKTQTDIWGDEI